MKLRQTSKSNTNDNKAEVLAGKFARIRVLVFIRRHWFTNAAISRWGADTRTPASNWTIYKVFHTLCYDRTDDDPWVYMNSPAKDYLSDEMRKSCAAFAKHFLQHTHALAWRGHVAIDPHVTVLPSTRAQTDGQMVAAMGSQKMMSRKSRFKAANLRAPATAGAQGRVRGDTACWAPVYPRQGVCLRL